MTEINGVAVDLSALMPEETTVYEVRKPGSREPTGWKIILAGISHPKAQAWSNAQQRRSLHRAAQVEAQQANGRKVKPDERELDEVTRENVGWVVSRIVDWTPVKIGAETYVFSDQVATELLLQPKMGWVFVQLIEAITDETAFLPRSATS